MLFGYRVGNTTLWGIGIVAILALIAGGMMLKKAGECPWKILIPIYGGYCLYKIASAEGIFWGTFVVSIISGIITRIVASNISRNTLFFEEPDLQPVRIIAIIAGVIILIMQFVFARQLADAFGKGIGFAIGLFLLFPIFAMILGFGSAVYGGRGGLDRYASSVGTWKCHCGCENPVSRASCANCGAQKQ